MSLTEGKVKNQKKPVGESERPSTPPPSPVPQNEKAFEEAQRRFREIMLWAGMGLTSQEEDILMALEELSFEYEVLTILAHALLQEVKKRLGEL